MFAPTAEAEVSPLVHVSAEDLIKRFEADMVYDAHKQTTRFHRSDAQKELSRRGKAVLGDIVRHLQRSSPNDDLAGAWCNLLLQIELKVDPQKTGPDSLRDVVGWAAWAQKFAV